MSKKAPALSRSEEITLSSQMLFPPQAKAKINVKGKIHRIAGEESGKQQNQQSAIEKRETTNIIMRWNYSTDKEIEHHQQRILTLPKTIYDSDLDTPSIVGSEYIEVPRVVPTDGLILTTREALLAFLERAPAIVRDRAKVESMHGQIAGSLLWYMYHMRHCNLAKPSVNAAKKICEAHYPRRFITTPGRPKKSEQRRVHSYKPGTLSATWRNFSSVAHLWAALLALNDDIIEPTDMPLEGIDFPRFIWYAKIFSAFGSQYVNRNAPNKKPVLNSDSLIEPSLDPSGDLAMLEHELINPHVKQYMEKIIREKGIK